MVGLSASGSIENRSDVAAGHNREPLPIQPRYQLGAMLKNDARDVGRVRFNSDPCLSPYQHPLEAQQCTFSVVQNSEFCTMRLG